MGQRGSGPHVEHVVGGHLELDERGHVLDAPAAPQAAEREDDLDQISGVRAPTLGQRLTAWGLPAWLRRHRRAVSLVAAAVVVVGSTSTAYAGTRLPVDDGAVEARLYAAVESAEAEAAGDFESAGMLQAAEGASTVYVATYRVAAVRPGDRIELLGLRGPGIAATEAHLLRTTAQGAVYSVLATLSCDDPEVLRAEQADYTLTVRRTDAFGRAATTQEPTTGLTGREWSDAVLTACLQRLASEQVTARVVGLRRDAATGSLHLDVRVHNALPAHLAASVAGPLGSSAAVLARWVDTTVPPGESVTIPAELRVLDCSQIPVVPTSDVPDGGWGGASDVGTPTAGVDVSLSLVARTDATALVLATWEAGIAGRAASTLRDLCAGAPATTTTVVSASPAPPSAAAAALAALQREVGVVLRTRVRVVTSGAEVTVKDADQLMYGDYGMAPLTTATATVAGGRAVVTVDWVTGCAEAGAPWAITPEPPRAGVLVWTQRDVTYPFLVSLDSEPLARALLSACPDLGPQDLPALGWSALAVGGR